MDLAATALLIGVCAWRLARLLTEEVGPFSIFERIRWVFGVRFGPIEGFFPTLFTCIYCMSVWTTIASYVLWTISPTAVMIIAAMGVALIAHSFADRS